MITTDRDIETIKPYAKNAKVHPEEQVRKVAASIKEFGFNQPIVVDMQGVIIVGHGRYEAATRILGLKTVPCVEIDVTEDQAKAYRLADNKLNESPWDMDLVIEELKGLSTPTIDLTGFDPEEIQGKIKADEIDQIAKESDIDLGKYNVLTVEAPEAPRLKARCSFYCKNIEQFNKIKEFFNERGGALDTKVLLELMNKK